MDPPMPRPITVFVFRKFPVILGFVNTRLH
jgi:hypothetical protein